MYSNLKLKQKGFTLIELLVVIAILGILAGFIVASFTSAQKKARDSQRKSDLDALKKALELAKGDSIGGSFYPVTLTAANLEPNYILKIPTDPAKTDCDGPGATVAPNYCYYVWGPIGGTGCVANNCTVYRLTARLENNRDPQRAGDTGNQSTDVICPGNTDGFALPAYDPQDYIVCNP